MICLINYKSLVLFYLLVLLLLFTLEFCKFHVLKNFLSCIIIFSVEKIVLDLEILVVGRGENVNLF